MATGERVQVADNAIDYPVADPADVGIDTGRLDDLLARAARDVTDGPLPSCQLAVARHGQLVASATFGDATADSRTASTPSTVPMTKASATGVIPMNQESRPP